MKNMLIFIYLALFPILGWAQNAGELPKPLNYHGCVVERKVENGKIQRLRIGYDNQSNYQYLTIGAKPNRSIKAVERVIFEYDKKGLTVYAYIPHVNERLDKKFLGNFDASVIPTKQQKTEIQLYYFNDLPDSTTIKHSPGSKQIIEHFKRKKIAKWTEAVLEKDLEKTITYQDFSPNSLKTLRDKYRAYKLPKWYFEAGGIVGLSYRTVQVVNPLPDRAIYESRLREDKAQFSWSGSLRGGYNFNASHSVYAGVLYLRQQFQSVGKIDWNSGLVRDPAGDVSKNRFDYWGTEIGYSYMYFRKRNEISVDVGMDLLWANNRNSTHKFTLGPNIAIGPKFRVGAGADLRIMPTFYYNLRALEKHKSGASQQELATRMFTTGIKMSVRWN